ncbi:MAG TPA: EAL domain-containing protein [Usitatibacteraceae bacterium]|nr:EAL domain-containing protein [Usitatibacteraceae bacterium]
MLETGQSSAGVPGMAGTAPAWRVGTSFQPLFSVRDAALAGFEALARPMSGAIASVRPSAYFAAHGGADLARIDRECRHAHLSRFASLDQGEGFLCLNMHPRSALADVTAADLRAELGLHGLEPSRICIELLGDASGDEKLLAEVVAACRAIGVRVTMDNFGVAHSNFDRVMGLAPDFVKIDRSLVGEAAGCAKARCLLPSVIRLLHDAGTQVIVEGIEEAPHALLAIEAGADFVQGYYFGAPRAVLSAEPLTLRLLAELKKVHRAPVPDPDDCDVDPANFCLARLLMAGRALAVEG